MDDDVKNLFQKFGQTNPSYQEINRNIESDQARQRWPLLRDVQVQTHPDNMPTPVSEDKPLPLFRSASASAHKPVLKDAQPVAQHAVNPAAQSALNGNSHPAVGEQAAYGSLPEQPVAGLFEHVREISSPVAPTPSSPVAAPSAAAAERSPFMVRQPDAVKTPEPSAQPSPRVASPLFSRPEPVQKVTVADDARKSLSAIFNRLAARPEEVKTNDTPVNSFFKKIFRS